MAGFSEAKEMILHEVLELPFGRPSPDRFSRVIQALNPVAFAAFLSGLPPISGLGARL
ncbi:MAG: transposase family protein [Rhodobacteraceae bacterium]|nr:transposase family protein [Paracoccaceae bacterium]